MKTIEYHELRTILKNNVKSSCELRLMAKSKSGNVVKYEVLNFDYCNKTTLLTITRYVNHAKKTWLNGWDVVANLKIDNATYVVEMF